MLLLVQRKGFTFFMNKKYSKEFKFNVVGEYPDGNNSIKGLTRKYEISSDSVVHKWIGGYEKDGAAYFDVERRGKRGGRPHKIKHVNLDDMTLEEQVEYLKMENAILKNWRP